MTRMSKQDKRRNMSPKKRHPNLSKKTGPKKDQLKEGYKVQQNALENPENVFIPKIR